MLTYNELRVRIGIINLNLIVQIYLGDSLKGNAKIEY